MDNPDAEDWDGWFCYKHLALKVCRILKLKGFTLDCTMEELIKFIKQNNERLTKSGQKWICPNCLDNITELNIKHYIQILKTFLNLQYGNESGRLKLKDIEDDSDYAWHCVCIPALLSFFTVDYDVNILAKYGKSDEFMNEGRDDFLNHLRKLRDRCNSRDDWKHYIDLLPSNYDAVWKDILQLKSFILNFLSRNVELLIKKEEEFKAKLWEEMYQKIAALPNIEFMYRLELTKTRIEAILETMCSVLKILYNASMETTNLKKLLKANLLISKCMKQRSIVLEGLVYLYQILFDFGCEYETDSYASKYENGQTMDRIENGNDESALTLDCSKNYHCELGQFFSYSNDLRHLT